MSFRITFVRASLAFRSFRMGLPAGTHPWRPVGATLRGISGGWKGRGESLADPEPADGPTPGLACRGWWQHQVLACGHAGAELAAQGGGHLGPGQAGVHYNRYARVESDGLDARNGLVSAPAFWLKLAMTRLSL